jgi:YD repeat-containing protein
MGANVTANCVDPGMVKTRLNRDREGFLTGMFTAQAQSSDQGCIGLSVQSSS